MNQFGQQLALHWEGIAAGASPLIVAAIHTMPESAPGWIKHVFSQDMWTWLRDALQTMIPLTRHPSTPPPVNPVPDGSYSWPQPPVVTNGTFLNANTVPLDPQKESSK